MSRIRPKIPTGLRIIFPYVKKLQIRSPLAMNIPTTPNHTHCSHVKNFNSQPSFIPQTQYNLVDHSWDYLPSYLWNTPLFLRPNRTQPIPISRTHTRTFQDRFARIRPVVKERCYNVGECLAGIWCSRHARVFDFFLCK